MNIEQLIKDLLDKNIIKIGESINYKRFKQIHSNGYSHISEYDFAEMAEMPDYFLYPKLKVHDDEVQDFCIEFWNNGRDFILFKLLDLLRLF